jgi:hypothetical protein
MDRVGEGDVAWPVNSQQGWARAASWFSTPPTVVWSGRCCRSSCPTSTALPGGSAASVTKYFIGVTFCFLVDSKHLIVCYPADAQQVMIVVLSLGWCSTSRSLGRWVPLVSVVIITICKSFLPAVLVGVNHTHKDICSFTYLIATIRHFPPSSW